MTGRRWERKLVVLLTENGWAVMKSPSSGSGTGRDQPDLLVGNAAVGLPPLAMEAKTSAKNAITIEEQEAEQLRRFAEDFGAVPVIAVYWKGQPGGNVSYGGWWFRELSEVRRSPVTNEGGGHHLRPRREDRRGWASPADLCAGRLAPEAAPA